MKKYDQIYINGDSYSACKNHPVYSDFIHQTLNIDVINHAVAGSNNHRIFRRTLEDLNDFQNTLVIIGLSFVTRNEVWYDGKDLEILNRIPDRDKIPSTRLLTLDFLLDKSFWDKNKADILVDLNINQQLIHFYDSLYMFTNTLENLGVDYFIFSAADNSDWRNVNWNCIRSLRSFQACNANPRIYKLHEFNIPLYSKTNNLSCTNTGHMFENGHLHFSNFLLNHLNLV